MLTDKGKKLIRKQLRKYFGHANLTEIRKILVNQSVNQYGANSIKIDLGEGIKIAYTSNPNHFAKFYFALQFVGSVETLAITKNDITKAGKLRGCQNYFAL
jgi:hypothetical protein